MYIDQQELDALTEELMMEAFAKDNEGITAKIYRNIHYRKFRYEAERRLKNTEMDNRIRENAEWFNLHDFNIHEFEMDMREVLKKHHVNYFSLGGDTVQVTTEFGSFVLEISCIEPERQPDEDLAEGYSDAWIANAHTGSNNGWMHSNC